MAHCLSTKTIKKQDTEDTKVASSENNLLLLADKGYVEAFFLQVHCYDCCKFREWLSFSQLYAPLSEPSSGLWASCQCVPQSQSPLICGTNSPVRGAWLQSEGMCRAGLSTSGERNMENSNLRKQTRRQNFSDVAYIHLVQLTWGLFLVFLFFDVSTDFGDVIINKSNSGRFNIILIKKKILSCKEMCETQCGGLWKGKIKPTVLGHSPEGDKRLLAWIRLPHIQIFCGQ